MKDADRVSKENPLKRLRREDSSYKRLDNNAMEPNSAGEAVELQASNENPLESEAPNRLTRRKKKITVFPTRQEDITHKTLTEDD